MALDSETATLPTDIEVVLELAPQGAAARDALAHVMATERSWAGSELCGGGFPVEFAFHTAKDVLCWTADPARGLSAEAQWDTICRFAADLGDPVTHPVARDLPSLDIPLRAGTWISGRHGAEGQFDCKIYTDWQDRPDLRALLPRLHLDDRLPNGARPLMRGLGLGPGKGRAELYYTFPTATLRHIHHLLAFAGHEAQADAVMAALTLNAKGQIEHALADTGLIASLAEDGPDSPLTLTLYLCPRAFCGNDKRVRAWFLQRLAAAGRDDSVYARASAALAHRVHYNLFHGLIALTVTGASHGWGLGLRPRPFL